jgi:hypothetical protein
MLQLGVIHVFLPLILIGLFGAESAYESPNLWEIFLSRTKSILTEKQFATLLCF